LRVYLLKRREQYAVHPVSRWQVPPRERTHASLASHAGALADRKRRVGKVAEAKCAHDSVECAGVEGQRVDTRFAKRAARVQSAGEIYHTRREVHASDEGPTPSGVHGHHTGSTGDVEHSHARTHLGCFQQRLCCMVRDRGKERVVSVRKPVVRVTLEISECILINVVGHGRLHVRTIQ